MELVKGSVKLEWEYIGEGIIGDFDETNPEDEALLRFYTLLKTVIAMSLFFSLILGSRYILGLPWHQRKKRFLLVL